MPIFLGWMANKSVKQIRRQPAFVLEGEPGDSDISDQKALYFLVISFTIGASFTTC